MALSGEFTGTTANQYTTAKIVWSATQDTVGNKSTITASLYYTKSSKSNASTGGTWSGTIVIGGYSNSYSGVKVTLPPNNSSVLIATFTKTIDHNTDGTKSITISATGAISGTTLSSTSISRAVELDTIPRASTISCTEANIESYPVITIARASSSFTHTITYHFGTLGGVIADKTGATSITSWKIPASFYAQIPNAKRGHGTLRCTTYSGSNEIGTFNLTFWVSTDETKCKPTVSGSVVDTNSKTVALTGDAQNTLVRFFSTASCTLSATLNKDAGSFKAKTINNVSVTDQRIIENVETGVFDFYARDSREYFNSYKVVKSLVPYVKLTNDATIQRDDPTSGNATLTIRGNYYNGSFGAANNSLSVGYRLGNSGDYTYVTPTITDNTYSATVKLTGLDYTKAFNYEVVVTDKLMSVTKPLTIQKGIPVFDWGENDFNFNVPVTINGVNILEKLAELEQLVKG